MRPAFGGHTQRRKPHINITSLIDVMFILLIFLMITTTFREHLGIRITLPQVGNAEKQELTTHEITITETGELYFGQQRVNEQGLRDSLVKLFHEDPKATLVLRADQKADFGTVIRAIDIARQIGGERLIIPTRTDAARSL